MLTSAESSVAMDTLVLAASSDCRIIEGAVRRIVAFACVLIVIIGTLIGVGAAPPIFAAILGTWVVAGAAALLYVRRRKARHGRVVLDFDAEQCELTPLRGPHRTEALRDVRVETWRSADVSAPVWIVLRTARGPFYLGRGSEPDAERLLGVLRSFHVPVKRAP